MSGSVPYNFTRVYAEAGARKKNRQPANLNNYYALRIKQQEEEEALLKKKSSATANREKEAIVKAGRLAEFAGVRGINNAQSQSERRKELMRLEKLAQELSNLESMRNFMKKNIPRLKKLEIKIKKLKEQAPNPQRLENLRKQVQKNTQEIREKLRALTTVK
jgi:hypothetical protein